MRREIIKTGKAPAAIGPYSQGVKVGKFISVAPAYPGASLMMPFTLGGNHLIFTAGQIPIDPGTGEIAGKGIKEQTKQVLENIKAVLEAADAELADVVKTTVYLKDMSHFQDMNEVYGEYFGENPPARSAVEVARLPKDVLIEMEAIACA